MKNEPSSTSTNGIGNKIRFSLVWKLNIRLFLRLVVIFLTINVFLCFASVAAVIVRTEMTVTNAAQLLNQSGLPSEDADSWLKLQGYSVSLLTEEQEGFRIPNFIQKILPNKVITGSRSVHIPESESMDSWRHSEGILYNVTIDADGRTYLISISLKETLIIFLGIFVLLLILEILMLLGSISSGAGTIRRALRPIEELAETAQNLNTDGTFTPQQLAVLAGKLDDINVSRLDTRISVNDTQSELKTLAGAINDMLDRINASYRSQVRFVSDASHELRTPISVIQGYANLLDRWGKNDEKALQESIDAIKAETANMKGLVEQLLFLARGDNNTMALQIDHFELSLLALEVLRETQMIDSGHEYNSSVTSVFIKADKGLIKQAMRILIDNAIKYTPPGNRITVSVSGAGGFARLTVHDEGIGIASDAVPKIFDRFFRADESRARATGGTGLGLSIAKWITERHGGHMEVLSRQDIGTKISIVFPIAEENL
ncbi:sensor histidine kinase [Desulfosporosinus hippei]|uniref:histidine kinase n=1 Tax=Desulfosporosinus hippei DSM 8344 TaxID=1121419 RepID=A0A1G7W592_9FIRM|nr:HAMP domain-containing sensor histidine kinase [Desulfosporosinus hippei]SDG67146.1 Signal transduction histidine kinase [Desulfosporosinus hippei DSM 8344]